MHQKCFKCELNFKTHSLWGTSGLRWTHFPPWWGGWGGPDVSSWAGSFGRQGRYCPQQGPELNRSRLVGAAHPSRKKAPQPATLPHWWKHKHFKYNLKFSEASIFDTRTREMWVVEKAHSNRGVLLASSTEVSDGDLQKLHRNSDAASLLDQ